MTRLLLLLVLFGQIAANEPQVLKTFYLREGTTAPHLTEIITTLRKQLGLRFMSQNTGVMAITVRETPERIAQAETLLQSELRASSATLAINSDRNADEVQVVQTFYLGDSATPANLIETVTAVRTLLNVRWIATIKNPRAIAVRDAPSQIALASKVIADLNPSQPGTDVQTSAMIDAGKASEFAQRGFTGAERQIGLKNIHTEEGAREIVVALRTLLNNPAIEAKGNAIVLRDSENNFIVAERLIADLDKPAISLGAGK